MERGPVKREGIEWAFQQLGLLYKNQEKLEEAEKMLERALRGYEQVLGPDHTSTLETVNNLSNLYINQGKLEEAEKKYERALRRMEKGVGPDHTSTLYTANKLGNLYVSQGKLEEAEKMLERALRGYENTLGPDHISTLNTVTSSLKLYYDLFFHEIKMSRVRNSIFKLSAAISPNPMVVIIKAVDLCIWA